MSNRHDAEHANTTSALVPNPVCMVGESGQVAFRLTRSIRTQYNSLTGGEQTGCGALNTRKLRKQSGYEACPFHLSFLPVQFG
jgi:hypothetical protein